jgi:hypothetical protein
MKSLKFKNLQILSMSERKARQFEFHLNRNLILGMNHVGKSTLTKMAFETLGAYPFGELLGWDKAAITRLTILIDDQEFHVVRQLTHRAVFSSEGELLFTANREGEWANLLSVFLEFNLLLTDKSGKTATADAACMFLPFYINQDGGWSGAWHAFSGLARFQDATKSIIEYFTQIVPPAFYVAKTSADSENRAIKLIDGEMRILNRTRDRLAKSLEIVAPQITAEAFEVEIKELNRQLTTLNARQEFLRLDALSLEANLDDTNHQIALTTDALTRFGEDFSFLSKPRKDELTCPTCGAHHEESFLKVLNFAEDARTLSDMLIGLQDTRARLIARLAQCNIERSSFQTLYDDLQAVLEVKRGEIQFGDVIQSIGSGAALRAFDEEERGLESIRSSHLSNAHGFELEMKDLRSPKRKKKIRQTFQDRYSAAGTKLHLQARDYKKAEVSTRPTMSGSAGPRDVLAYYAALWWTSQSVEFGSPFSIPIVVDCPAQSGQDVVNLPAMLSFLSTGLPRDAQVFVTHEADVPDEFDKRIVLDRPFEILDTSEFEAISQVVLPKLEAMQAALLKARNVRDGVS